MGNGENPLGPFQCKMLTARHFCATASSTLTQRFALSQFISTVIAVELYKHGKTSSWILVGNYLNVHSHWLRQQRERKEKRKEEIKREEEKRRNCALTFFSFNVRQINLERTNEKYRPPSFLGLIDDALHRISQDGGSSHDGRRGKEQISFIQTAFCFARKWCLLFFKKKEREDTNERKK